VNDEVEGSGRDLFEGITLHSERNLRKTMVNLTDVSRLSIYLGTITNINKLIP